MPSPQLYNDRKAQRVCVRCGMKAVNGFVLCRSHRLIAQEYERGRKVIDADDLPGALSSPRQPADRAAYNGKPVRPLPPLPTTCPKCAAQLVPTFVELYLAYADAVRCLICGYLTDAQMLQNRLDMERERAEARRTG